MPVQANSLALYADSVVYTSIVNTLTDDIADVTKKCIANSSTKAAYTLLSVMADPTDLGVKEKMLAAKDILDRAGFVKTDRVEVKTSEPLFILPAKDNE